MHRTVVVLSILFLLCFYIRTNAENRAFAQENTQEHITVIINQVRGNECCSTGGVNELSQQINAVASLNIPAVFAVRFDALVDPRYTSLLQKSQGNEVAALLEITPKLASESGVEYKSSVDQWYRASNAFLIGYKPEDRLKLIDTYMNEFHVVFGYFPKTSVAWMIDPLSLHYLNTKYKITTHEITREQWGTDSYTLSGGPPHYPYIPIDNWALIPSASSSAQLPLIVRQTITDPVRSYGDLTSSFTSQPNDYLKRNVGIIYFQYLFTQAHNQPTERYTFALIGLENSMPVNIQNEYIQQLHDIKDWLSASTNNHVMLASDFATWWGQHAQPNIASAYQGNGRVTQQSRAWWITTPSYRVRLRLDNGDLYISDIRIYSSLLTDPYITTPAKLEGFWIAPFLLDGSRFWDHSSESQSSSAPDALSNRTVDTSLPVRIEIKNGISSENALKYHLDRAGNSLVFKDPDEKVIFVFDSSSFQIPSDIHQYTDNPLVSHIAFSTNERVWQWMNKFNHPSWGIKLKLSGNSYIANPWMSPNELDTQRIDKYPLLLPEMNGHKASYLKTEFYAQNYYAIAGEKPVKMVFLPRDENNYPIHLQNPPTIDSSPQVTDINIQSQRDEDDIVNIDINQSVPGRYAISLSLDGFKVIKNVFFAPNCMRSAFTCIAHPEQAWWYIRSLLEEITTKIDHKLNSNKTL